MTERRILTRRVLLGVYFFAAFFIFLLVQFPFDRIKYRIEHEVQARTPFSMSVSGISPRFFNRFVLTGVALSDREGRVFFDASRVYFKISLLSLLKGMTSFSMDSNAYGGKLFVRMRQGRDLQSYTFDANGLDISAYQLLKDMGLNISGRLSGSFEMTNGVGSGRIWIKNLAWRGLMVKGFRVPDLDLDQAWLEADIKADRLFIKKLEAEGKEMKIRMSGDAVLRERGSLNMSVKFKPSERIAREQAGLLSLLKNRDGEGFYHLTLGGTIDAPMPRL